MFRNRLVKVYRHLAKQAGQLGVSCYRLYDHDMPEFPFCIEVYGENLYIAEYKRKHRMEDILDIQRDHPVLINDCIRILKPGASLYFITNYQKFVLEKEKIKAELIKDITRQTTPFDFEGRLQRLCFRIEK